MKGILIAIEGINGCGKSSIIQKLVRYFHSLGLETSVYKFPDRSGAYGDQIDRFLRNQNVFEYKYDMFNAFAMNRLAVREDILKDIKRGAIVICDRYIASAIAYHVPLRVSPHALEAYKQVLGYFDKDMLVPIKTYLISGDFLHLRAEERQRYHYNDRESKQLLDVFKKIVPDYSSSYCVVQNVYNRLDDTVAYMAIDIMKHQQ